jgi:hypothetical protein
MIAKCGNIAEKPHMFARSAASIYNNFLKILPFSPYIAVFTKTG